MNIIYMGTPDFAVCPLERLIEAGHNISLVVTQPDKEKGRGKEIAMSPVKECALKHNLPVFQPVKIKDEESVSELKKYEADIYVVAAFGQLLSMEVLSIPKYGCVNIHASLLPKYRGAAPIQWAILDGEKSTGVTVQQMELGLDTGDILSSKEIDIDPEDTGESLFDKLMYLGADLIVETLDKIEKGEITPVKQKDEESNYAKKITKEMGLIDWKDSAYKIERYVRGLNSWPSAYTKYKGKTLKIWKSKVFMDEAFLSGANPGEVVRVSKDSIIVACGEGFLKVLEIQMEGKKRMSVHDFLLGVKIQESEILGEN